ncbi:hypothetical protein BH23CHL4_BH23CHL4_14880 [soil metagenome]
MDPEWEWNVELVEGWPILAQSSRKRVWYETQKP